MMRNFTLFLLVLFLVAHKYTFLATLFDTQHSTMGKTTKSRKRGRETKTRKTAVTPPKQRRKDYVGNNDRSCERMRQHRQAQCSSDDVMDSHVTTSCSSQDEVQFLRTPTTTRSGRKATTLKHIPDHDIPARKITPFRTPVPYVPKQNKNPDLQQESPVVLDQLQASLLLGTGGFDNESNHEDNAMQVETVQEESDDNDASCPDGTGDKTYMQVETVEDDDNDDKCVQDETGDEDEDAFPEKTLKQCFEDLKEGRNPGVPLHMHPAIKNAQKAFSTVMYSKKMHYCMFCCATSFSQGISTSDPKECKSCEVDRRDHNGIRRLAEENNCSPLPFDLRKFTRPPPLTEIEEMLIAKVFSIMKIFRLVGGQTALRGNILNVAQDISSVVEATTLPHSISSLPILLVRKPDQKSASGYKEFKV